MKSAKYPNRREVLGGLGAMGVIGVSSSALATEAVDASTDSDITTKTDRLEYARLRDLDLDAPEVLARRQKMPTGKIGDITFGRLMSGSNLISMNMHARDLDYVSALAERYNTEERILMTLKLCEEYGVNGIVLKNHNFARFRLSRYWDEWGGNMKWLADVITTDINQYERLLEEHIELGASAAYLWGGAADVWCHQGNQKNIIKAYEIMRKHRVPVGICAHRLEPIRFCEKEGLKPDFYMKTLHHDRYWSAHPKENRRFIEMYEANSPNHAQYHDNMFCHDHEETVEFMQDVKVPWIAFKVLAAGAIPAQDGIAYAFESGADFICLGMFDWQVRQDVEIVVKAIEKSRNRKRPWMA
ncbi:MAG: hypothetical protein JXN61_06635 [Sedimentisphaerales bacterium]|nr:hypothetical protein [Sedimentisphaerales bacterium]